jgi:hypothetical protein
MGQNQNREMVIEPGRANAPAACMQFYLFVAEK